MLAARHHVIVGVSLNTETGKLVGYSLIPHWVVVEGIEDDDKVTIYNPFSNKHEDYPWDLFLNSVLAFGNNNEEITAIEIVDPGKRTYYGSAQPHDMYQE
jgi:hypothetical protein